MMMMMIMIMIMFFYGLPWITIIQITIVRTMAIFFFHLFIFSVLGRKPYSGLGGIEIVDFLKSGKRLQQPDGCSDEM